MRMMTGDRFINALAIRADRQGEGLGGLVLRTLLDDLSDRFPGRVATWLVAPPTSRLMRCRRRQEQSQRLLPKPNRISCTPSGSEMGPWWRHHVVVGPSFVGLRNVVGMRCPATKEE